MKAGHSGIDEVRKHLGRLLRKCRARAVADPGNFRTKRRRQGISQETTATLLGCSTRWYATLESGRMKNATPEFLESVAAVLQMNDQERQFLFLYVTGELSPAADRAHCTLHPRWAQLVERQPYPACIYTRCWDLVVANPGYLDLVFGVRTKSVAEMPDRNVLRWCLLNEAFRTERLVDWRDSWAVPVLGELRAAIAANPDSQDLMALLDSLLADPVVKELWDAEIGALPTHPDGTTLSIDDPARGRVEFTVLAANVMHARDLSFVTLMPTGPGCHPGPVEGRDRARLPLNQKRPQGQGIERCAGEGGQGIAG
ncbi:helix-turn-helix transcriptional regulator [Streptomyces sp. NPDC002785]|uniref:helix-turn-helix domain-containing protein n=1 Tax=Streptomyces sp. NPDC002785 TaxID=3154543 RepID=UPI0033289A6E